MSYFPEIAKDGLRLIVAKISNSRQELELRIVSDNTSQYENFQFNLGNEQVTPGDFYSRFETLLKAHIDSNESDVVVPVGDGTYIPVVNLNYYIDTQIQGNDVNKFLFVIKLSKPLPPSFKKLGKISLLTLVSEIVSNDVIYAGKVEPKPQKFGSPLEVDYTSDPFEIKQKESSTYQSYSQITQSLPARRFENIVSSSGDYKSQLVDYSKFENFVHFSSAEERVKNYKRKLTEIENNLTIVSSSLKTQGQSLSTFNNVAKDIREQSFRNINTIIGSFTDYERWLYYDKQQTSLNSTPGFGKEYTNSSASIDVGYHIQQHFNKEGLENLFVISASDTEPIKILDKKYQLENIEFNNVSSSFYLSFLMRASSSVSDALLHSNTQTSSTPFYPMDSLSVQTIAKPNATGSEYRRYIFASSGSYWVPTNKKVVGLNKLDFKKGSSEIKLTSGSGIYREKVAGVGEYAQFLTYATSSGLFLSGSYVPRGDLFNLKINPTGDTNLNGIITDVKVTEKNPINIKPFHHLYSVTSTEFTSWYNGLLESASLYDTQNIQRLVHNLPQSFVDDTTLNQDLISYVNTIAEFFDEYKTLIDDYYRLFNKGYSDYEQVPTKYNKLLAENLGFNIFPIENNNFLELFGIGETLNNSNEYSNKVINNVLNNLSYLYKTKGTQNSIKALLNCYGLPSNVLRIKEGEIFLRQYDQDYLSNDPYKSANGLFDETGSVSYEVNAIPVSSLIINEDFDTDGFVLPWNPDSEVSQSAIEAVFKIPPTENTMSLITSKNNDNTKELWHVQVLPSGSSQPNKAKFRLRISPTPGGSTAIGIQSSSLFVDTDYLNVTDNSLINVAVQHSSSVRDNSAVNTYNLIVGKSTNDKISVLTSKTLLIDGDSDLNGNKNFNSGSKGNHLFMCQNFTGSIAQIKSWKTPLSFTAFKQHIYNKKSIVGNNFSSSVSELQYYYPLQENYTSGSGNFDLIDSSINNKGGTISLDSNMFNSMSIHYDSTIVQSFRFPIFGSGGGTSDYSDNLITIGEEQKMDNYLSPEKSVLRYNNSKDYKNSTHTRNLYLTRSPQEIINDFLRDNLGDRDFNDLFADPRDDFKTRYDDLDKFNEQLKSYKISIDMTRFIEATKKIFNSSFVESLKKLVPAKAKLNIGNVIKPIYTDRVKLPPLLSAPSSEVLIQPAGTKDNFEAPNFNESALFRPPEDTFIGFQKAHKSSSLGDFEQTNFKDIGYDDITDIGTEYFHNTELAKQNPQKLWGSSSADLHFKNEYAPGLYGDYNTYHYESDVVFTSIGDIELVNNTTSSFNKGVFNTNYTASKTFVNRKLIETSPVVGERFMGKTQQVYPTSTIKEYGKVLDTNTLIPTNHIAYSQYPRYYDRTFRGSQLTGSSAPVTNYPGNVLWDASQEVWNPFFDESGTYNQEWEDLSKNAFYRITFDTPNTNQLRIVREQDTNQGNQTN